MKLRGIVAFLRRFQAPGFKFGHWTQPPSDRPGVMILPHFSLSDVARSFKQTAHKLGWVVRDFDWGTWMQTPEAQSLRDDDQVFAQATPEQLARLLTVCIRQDRFCEGALESAFESGLLTRILERADAILSEIDQKSEGRGQTRKATMAVALHPKFPVPDRSKQPVRSTKDPGGVIDIGWCDGVISDGRAFRAEMWAQNQVSMLTIFFSAIGLEELDEEAVKAFVQKEGLVSFRNQGQKYCAADIYFDDVGNRLWSVNIVVGDEDETYVEDSIPIFKYSDIGEPNTMFNPMAIKAAHGAS